MIAAVCCVAACSPEKTASAECFHVSYASQGDRPASAMRWNSCTGETWLLLEEDAYQNGQKSWPRESAQGDKWIFCLTAARIAA